MLTIYTGEIMSFYVEDRGASFERTPSGMHLARCYRIIDLGTQKSEYMGQVKYLHKIMLGWEIHGTDDSGKPIKMNDGRPFAMFKNYTLSWSEKANLRLDLQSWRGKPFTQEEMRKFDLKNILGAWCMINVIERQGQNGNTYSNVDSVTPVPPMIKQNGLPQPVNKNEIFNLQEPDWAIFETFSDNLKQKIIASPEFEKAKKGDDYQKNAIAESNSHQAVEEDDDIPF
jgi:hypothetical protein